MAPYSQDDQNFPTWPPSPLGETAPVHALADVTKRLAGSGPITCATGGSAFRAHGIRFRSVARDSEDAAILKATALPAITCSSGPPCWPGNTESHHASGGSYNFPSN
jgi:hypothetical protein